MVEVILVALTKEQVREEIIGTNRPQPRYFRVVVAVRLVCRTVDARATKYNIVQLQAL